jgi:hypothetical protein
LLNGITPDFQVELENIHVFPILSQVAEDHDLSDVCLIAAATVDPTILKYFKNAIFFFRPYLTPFPIFCESDRHCLENPDPTVVNAGLSFAHGAGFRDIYFFGVDMGTRDPAKHHSKDAYHYTPGAIPNVQPYEMSVPGNFSGACLTSVGLYLARGLLIRAIDAGKVRHRHFNCSDGAMIDGAKPTRHETISLQDIDGGKTKLRQQLIEGIGVFTRGRFERAWNTEQLGRAIDGFLDQIVDALKKAAPFRNKRYLTTMMSIVRPNLEPTEIIADRTNSVARLLFRGTVMMLLIVFEYFLNRVAEDKRADAFAEIGLSELLATLEHLRTLAFGLIRDPVTGGPPKEDRSSPQIGNPDSVDLRNTNIPRNTPCPCGSGRRYKNCHGKLG